MAVAKLLAKVFDQVHERVAGLDVHKAQVTAAIRVPGADYFDRRIDPQRLVAQLESLGQTVLVEPAAA